MRRLALAGRSCTDCPYRRDLTRGGTATGRVMSEPHTAIWMTGAYLGSLVIAGLVLMTLGAGQHATLTGLQLTARWSFCFFIPAYVGGAAAALFGSAFRPLARQGRNLGLAFASAHVTHLCFVAWIYYISIKPPLPLASAMFFGFAALLTYALALFSIPAMAQKLPSWAWWGLRTLGMDLIAIAFLWDFLRHPFGGSLAHLAGYLPFICVAFAALLIRLAAYGKQLQRRWLAPQLAR